MVLGVGFGWGLQVPGFLQGFQEGTGGLADYYGVIVGVQVTASDFVLGQDLVDLDALLQVVVTFEWAYVYFLDLFDQFHAV
jgi:hypothetical protein